MGETEIPPEIRATIDRYGAASVIGWAVMAAHAPAPSAAKWIDQGTSPLGPRRHCSLARRLIEAGDARASKAGRRWLVRSDALNEALSHLGQEKVIPAPSAENELARSYGFDLEES